MKNNIFISLICFLCVFSCVKNDDGITVVDVDQLTDVYSDSETFLIDGTTRNFVYPRLEDGIVVTLGPRVGLAGNPKLEEIDYEYEIFVVPPSSDPSVTVTNATEGVQYTADLSRTIPAGELTETLPIMIDLDNCELGLEYSIGVQLKSCTIDNFQSDPIVYTFTALCPDPDISGIVYATSEDNFSTEATIDTVTISAVEGAAGAYVMDDFSFGSYLVAYGGDAASWGELQFNYVCNKISYSGLDNYQDTWEITEIIESNGPNLTFVWSNSYGEFGTVTLVREDGIDWLDLRI